MYIKEKVSKLFGLAAPDNYMVLALPTPVAETPLRNPDYVFRRDLIRDIRAFFLSGETMMQLYGYSGAGKSSVVEQYHAATNLPLLTITAHPDMLKSDLIGKFIMTSSGMEWRDGPLVKAARHGWSVLIDEFNLLDPAVGTSLNGWLEGRGEFIEEIGEMVRPKEGFRVFAASNPADVSKGHLGRNNQDASNDDRAWFAWVDYPTKEEEMPLVEKALSGMDDSSRKVFASNMVDVANKIRLCYTSNGEQELSVTMSTRTLLRWAKMTLQFAGAPSAVHYALERALTFRPSIEQHEREAIHEIVHQVFGQPYQASRTF